MILAHHGYGEEVVLYAIAGAFGTVPLILALASARLAQLRRMLRRR
jgi:hypothetical protein